MRKLLPIFTIINNIMKTGFNKRVTKIFSITFILLLLVGVVVGIVTFAEENNTGEILQSSIVHNDKIQIAFKVNATEADVMSEKVVLKYTWSGSEEEKTAAVRTVGSADGAYIFVTEGVAAYELAKVVTATTYIDGVEADTKTYSVAQFLYTMLYVEDCSEAADACYEALLEYGAASQTHLLDEPGTLVTNYYYIYTDAEGCTVDGENRLVLFNSGSVNVAPTYSGDYTLDYWLVYNAENGNLTRSIEEGGSLARSASFRVHPVFLTDDLSDVASNITLTSYGKLNGASSIDLIDTASPEWDDIAWNNKLATSNKSDSLNSTVNKDVVSLSSGGYFCVIPDVKDAANEVLLMAQKAASGYGNFRPAIDIALDANDAGSVYVAQFDINLEYSKSANGIITLYFVDSASTRQSLGNVTVGTAMTDYTGASISDTYYVGNKDVKFDSDTWYTLRIVYCDGALTYYYSVDGGETFTKYHTGTATLAEGATYTHLRIEGNVYNSTSITLFDDLSFDDADSVSTTLVGGTSEVIAPAAEEGTEATE